MLRLRIAITGSLVMFLATGWLMGQDSNKDSKDKEPTPATAKTRTVLPKYFAKLNLTEDQKQKVLKVHGSYKTRIDALKDQIEELTNQEKGELNKLLDDAQRAHLRELSAKPKAAPAKEKSAPDKGDKKEEKKEDKKEDKKEER